jgi:hypothetical protein
MNEFTTSAPDPAIPMTFGGIGPEGPGKFDGGVWPEHWSPTKPGFVPVSAHAPSTPEYSGWRRSTGKADRGAPSWFSETRRLFVMLVINQVLIGCTSSSITFAKSRPEMQTRGIAR